MSDRYQKAYSDGVMAYRFGHPDINPYGLGSMMEMCAWSAGYFDAKRRMA